MNATPPAAHAHWLPILYKYMLCSELHCNLLEVETPFSSTIGGPEFQQLPCQSTDEKYTGENIQVFF